MPTPGATSSGFWSGGQRPLRPMGSGRGVLRQGWPASSPRLEKPATWPCSSTAPTAMASGMVPAGALPVLVHGAHGSDLGDFARRLAVGRLVLRRRAGAAVARGGDDDRRRVA